jgi:hypothetical protein
MNFGVRRHVAAFQSADVSAHSKFERRRKLKDPRAVEDSVISTEVEKSFAVICESLLVRMKSRNSSTALGMTTS